MTPKSLRIFVQILLLGLLLGTSLTAYADAVSITSLNFNLQITPAAGTIQITPSGAFALAQAENSLGGQSSAASDIGNMVLASVNIQFANASGVANITDRSASASSGVNVSGCTCQASSESDSGFALSFVILGGTGNVDVTLSALLVSMQSVRTDEFGVSALSEVDFALDLDGVQIFSHDFRLSIPSSSSERMDVTRELSEVMTLQFGTRYEIVVLLNTRSEGANEIPEPATVVLLVSGLGFMAGFVKKRRDGLR